ncbi:unnamed protein product [Vicia faba]|uniref:Uncharacterized protein n=1 Tax=Vicia faba TaxID=3906 RepID=A0AAV1B3L6_VICFA|nr:unnamed protein product [Vicia faba]
MNRNSVRSGDELGCPCLVLIYTWSRTRKEMEDEGIGDAKGSDSHQKMPPESNTTTTIQDFGFISQVILFGADFQPVMDSSAGVLFGPIRGRNRRAFGLYRWQDSNRLQPIFVAGNKVKRDKAIA